MGELLQLELQRAGMVLEISCSQTRQVHEPSDDKTDSNERRKRDNATVRAPKGGHLLAGPPGLTPDPTTYVLAARLIPARRAGVSSRSLQARIPACESIAMRHELCRNKWVPGTSILEQ